MLEVIPCCSLHPYHLLLRPSTQCQVIVGGLHPAKSVNCHLYFVYKDKWAFAVIEGDSFKTNAWSVTPFKISSRDYPEAAYIKIWGSFNEN